MHVIILLVAAAAVEVPAVNALVEIAECNGVSDNFNGPLHTLKLFTAKLTLQMARAKTLLY